MGGCPSRRGPTPASSSYMDTAAEPRGHTPLYTCAPALCPTIRTRSPPLLSTACSTVATVLARYHWKEGLPGVIVCDQKSRVTTPEANLSQSVRLTGCSGGVG